MQWQSAVGLKYNGTVYTWGYGTLYATGQNTTSDITTPTQLSGLTGIVDICNFTYSNLALKSNGTLWGWGNNGEYELGVNNTTTPTTPIQIGTDTDWAKIGGHFYTGAAIKTNGKLYTWGFTETSNYFTGQNTTSNITVPTKYNDDTDWLQIPQRGYRSSFSGLRTNKKRYYFGQATEYKLGNYNNSTAIRIPTKFSDLTFNTILNGGGNHGLALRFSPYADSTIINWTGLRNYWRMEDATDAMGNRNLTGSTVTYGTGKNNNCGIISNNGYWKAAEATDTYFRNQTFSLGGWWQINLINNASIFWSHDYTSHSSPYYACHFRQYSNTYTFYWNRGGIVKGLNIPLVSSTGVWYHGMVTCTPTRVRLYLNGSIVEEDTTNTGNITYYNRETWIGNSPNLLYNANTNKFDEWSYWIRELTPQEVMGLYNAGNGIYY